MVTSESTRNQCQSDSAVFANRFGGKCKRQQTLQLGAHKQVDFFAARQPGVCEFPALTFQEHLNTLGRIFKAGHVYSAARSSYSSESLIRCLTASLASQIPFQLLVSARRNKLCQDVPFKLVYDVQVSQPVLRQIALGISKTSQILEVYGIFFSGCTSHRNLGKSSTQKSQKKLSNSCSNEPYKGSPSQKQVRKVTKKTDWHWIFSLISDFGLNIQKEQLYIA